MSARDDLAFLREWMSIPPSTPPRWDHLDSSALPPGDHPTLLLIGSSRQHVLPLEPAAYEVRGCDERGWSVSIRQSGEVIYQGAGPVAVDWSPAPF